MKTLLDQLFSATLLAIALMLCVHATGLAQQPTGAIVLTPALRPSYAQTDLTGVFGTNNPAVRTIGAQLDRALDNADLPALLEIARTMRAWEVAQHACAPALNANKICAMTLERAGLPADKPALIQLKAMLTDERAGFGTAADQPLIKATDDLVAATSTAAIRTRGPGIPINITISNKTSHRVQVKVNNDLVFFVEGHGTVTKPYTSKDNVVIVIACVPNQLSWEIARINPVSGTNITMDLCIKP